MNSHSIRWWGYGYLRVGPWVCGCQASSRGWYINLVCVGPGAGYVSRTSIRGAWLEMVVNCLCCTGTDFLRGLVVSPICPIIDFLVNFFQALGECNRARRRKKISAGLFRAWNAIKTEDLLPSSRVSVLVNTSMIPDWARNQRGILTRCLQIILMRKWVLK